VYLYGKFVPSGTCGTTDIPLLACAIKKAGIRQKRAVSMSICDQYECRLAYFVVKTHKTGVNKSDLGIFKNAWYVICSTILHDDDIF